MHLGDHTGHPSEIWKRVEWLYAYVNACMQNCRLVSEAAFNLTSSQTLNLAYFSAFSWWHVSACECCFYSLVWLSTIHHTEWPPLLKHVSHDQSIVWFVWDSWDLLMMKSSCLLSFYHLIVDCWHFYLWFLSTSWQWCMRVGCREITCSRTRDCFSGCADKNITRSHLWFVTNALNYRLSLSLCCIACMNQPIISQWYCIVSKWNAYKFCTVSSSFPFITDHFNSPDRTFSPVYLCLCVWTITFQQNDCWSRYLKCC